MRVRQEDIRRSIQQDLESGRYTRKLPSLRTLAGRYRADLKTVRNALEGLVEQHLVELRHGSGIYIAEGTHRSIGIVGNTDEAVFFEDPYYRPVMKSILRETGRRGDLFCYQHKSNRRYVHLFKNHTSVEAFLVFAPSAPHVRELRQLKTELPFILVGTTVPEFRLNYVDSDNLRDAERATCALIEKGHRAIAFVGAPEQGQSDALRLQGYRQALAGHGIACDETLLWRSEPLSPDAARKIQTRIQKSGITAVLAASTYSASIVWPSLGRYAKGLDWAIYDDFSHRKFTRPPHYLKIEQPLAEIGRAAIASLYQLLDGKKRKPVQILLPSRLRAV